MLAAVKFYYQQFFEAAEISDIRSDRILATKLDAQLPIPNPFPEFLLRVRMVAAKTSGEVALKLHRIVEA